MSKITVFGIMVADMVAQVERFPKEGETVLCRDFEVFLGGKGVNQCVSAKRLGGDVEMVGCLGADPNGRRFVELFDGEGIRHDKVLVREGSTTGMSLIQVNREGQNKIVVIPAANDEFGLEELEKVRGVFDTTEFALFQLEMREEVTFRAIEYAHKKGVMVMLNPAPARELPEYILAQVDYLTPNEVELGILAGEDTGSIAGVERASKKLLAQGVKNVVSTLGERGAAIANQDGFRVVPAYPVDCIVDTVAAGDSFNGALAVKLQEGASLDEAVKFANAMGALTVQVRGAIPSLHTRCQVEQFALRAGTLKNVQISGSYEAIFQGK